MKRCLNRRVINLNLEAIVDVVFADDVQSVIFRGKRGPPIFGKRGPPQRLALVRRAESTVMRSWWWGTTGIQEHVSLRFGGGRRWPHLIVGDPTEASSHHHVGQEKVRTRIQRACRDTSNQVSV